ncbi:MAG: hypothetical protein ACP5MZ_00020 [Candidatus Micrarchaeia archaeon]
MFLRNSLSDRMDVKDRKLSASALRSHGSDLALRAYEELKSNDRIEEKLKMLRRDYANYSVSTLGGMLFESESASMINETDLVQIDDSVYKAKRLIFTPKSASPQEDIKYAVTGFTEDISLDNYSKSEVIDLSTGNSKDSSNVLIGGSPMSLMLLDAGITPTSDIYFDYGEGGYLGSLKLELEPERISQKDIKDAFLRGYNQGGIEEGVTQLLAMAEQNFENYVCIVYPGLSIRRSESIINSDNEVVSREDAHSVELPTYVIFYNAGTSFITALSRSTPGSSLKNSLFKIRRNEIKKVSTARPYLGVPKGSTQEDMYQ